MVRPATTLEVDEAIARVTRDVAALQDASDAAVALIAVLGGDFTVGDVADKEKISALSQRLANMHLVMACQDGWGGVELEDDAGEIAVLEKPEPWSAALLLRDPVNARRIMAVVNSRVHLETSEGNGLPTSPTGGVGTDESSAPGAAALGTAAPTAGAPSMDQGVPSANMRQ